MALLGRAVRLLARLVLALLAALLHFLLRLLLPVAFVLLDCLIRLMTTSLVATVSGPRQYIDRMASEWTRRLLVFGVSREHMDMAYLLCRCLAMLLIMLGWVIAFLFAVAAVRIVHGILSW
jgi:hypothetical protein